MRPDGVRDDRARAAHRRRRRRRRRTAGADAGRAGELAAARRAHQRVAHRRQPDPLLPVAARRRARPAGSSGSSSSATRPCRVRSRRLLARDDVDRARRRHTRGVAGAAVPGRRPLQLRPADRRRSRTTRPGWRSGAPPTASVGRQLDALLAAEPDLTPYEVAGAVSRAAAARGAARRRCLQPDPRPRPDGRAVRRRRPPQGASPTAACPASTARSRRRSARRSAGRAPAGRWR